MIHLNYVFQKYITYRAKRVRYKLLIFEIDGLNVL